MSFHPDLIPRDSRIAPLIEDMVQAEVANEKAFKHQSSGFADSSRHKCKYKRTCCAGSWQRERACRADAAPQVLVRGSSPLSDFHVVLLPTITFSPNPP